MAEKKEEKKIEEKKAEEKKPEKKAAEKKVETKKAKETTEETTALHPTLQKKKERREAKAARKEANRVEEEKSRPNNLLLGILIFGVLIGMFAFVTGYKYFSKPASIEKYLEESGGEETYGDLQWDNYTHANITAKGNSMNIALTADTEEEEAIKELKEYYGGEDGKENLLDLAAYFLSNMKPEARGFGADATVSMKLNGEELNSVKLTYSEAKKRLKEQEKEAEEAADAGTEVNTDGVEVDTDAIEVDGENVEVVEEDGHVHEEGEEHTHEEGEEAQ